MPIRQRTDRERPRHQANEPGGEERAQARHRKPPFRTNGWRDEADERGIEAVNGDDHEAQEEQALLHRRQGVRVDERLDVDNPANGRLRHVIHLNVY